MKYYEQRFDQNLLSMLVKLKIYKYTARKSVVSFQILEISCKITMPSHVYELCVTLSNNSKRQEHENFSITKFARLIQQGRQISFETVRLPNNNIYIHLFNAILDSWNFDWIQLEELELLLRSLQYIFMCISRISLSRNSCSLWYDRARQ